MSVWKTNPDGACCFVTKTIVGWLPVVNSHEAGDIIIAAWQYALDYKSVHLHAYVIMPNHFHLIVSSSDGRSMSSMMRDFGTHRSRELSGLLFMYNRNDHPNVFHHAAWNDQRGNDFRIWQEGFHPIVLKSDGFYRQKRDYIHANPVRKGFVIRPEDWKYSTARNYIHGDHSVIRIECM